MDTIYEILEELHPEYDFRSNNGIIEEGILDSFDLISLVTMVEEKFDVMIDALDILPENFCSVEVIANVIRKNGGTV
jgi:acyl carrier protein